MSDQLTSDDRLKKYHEGWVKHQAEGKKDWTRYWMILRGNMLFIFKSEDTSHVNMVGSLTLSSETEIENMAAESKKKGFKFKLTTLSPQGERKVNRFKFDKENEKDVWKSFIFGIANGIVPSDVHLLPGQLRDIHSAIAEVRNTPPPVPTIPRPNIAPQRPVFKPSQDGNGSDDSGSFRSHVTRPSNGDGNVNNLRELMRRQVDLVDRSLETDTRPRSKPSPAADRSFMDEPRPNYHRSRSHSEGFAQHQQQLLVQQQQQQPSTEPSFEHDMSSSRSRTGEHIFYAERSRNQETPMWFFEHMSRDEAENILTVGRKFGNVLLRPSSNFSESGKYVISMRREVTGGTTLNHYEVLPVKGGFKINVDNKHQPMRSLSEVMDFFIGVAGPGTRAMRCNDLMTIYQSTLAGSRSESSPHVVSYSRENSYSGNSGSQMSPGYSRSQTEDFSSTTNSRALQVAGAVSPMIQQAVQDMNKDLGGSRTDYIDDNPRLDYVNYHDEGQYSPGLNRNVPPRVPPTETLQRTYGRTDTVTSRGSVPDSLVGLPPPPPAPPLPPGGIPNMPPPPPPLHPAAASPRFQPPAYGTATNGPPPMASPYGTATNGPPAMARGPPPTAAKPSFESELQGRLVKQREVVYATGAQVLTNY